MRLHIGLVHEVDAILIAQFIPAVRDIYTRSGWAGVDTGWGGAGLGWARLGSPRHARSLSVATGSCCDHMQKKGR